jgi:hypothetical protein
MPRHLSTFPLLAAVPALLALFASTCPAQRPGYEMDTTPTISRAPTPAEITAQAKLQQLVNSLQGKEAEKLFSRKVKVAGVEFATTGAVVQLSGDAAARPWRPETTLSFKQKLSAAIREETSAPLQVLISQRPIDDYVPPAWRADHRPRTGPATAKPQATARLRRNTSSGVPSFTSALTGRNIVLWASHGRLFDNKVRMLWQWQRPRMFTTVEDLLTMSYINPYLIPMLENAGAIVFNCRERDFQVHEAVVDDEDGRTRPARGIFEATGAADAFVPGKAKGFRNGLAPYEDGINPHLQGTAHEAAAVAGSATASVRWIPGIPADGDYAVYVSYAGSTKSAPDAHYTVRHAGGATSFLVNQQMVPNTWVYLGSFHFRAGADAANGCVELSNESATPGATISADAARFGGGMGDTRRGGAVSGYPRYAEGARYFLQYCGIDPKLIYAFRGMAGNEYNEEYVSRSEYGNYLAGAPCGPNAQPDFAGLGVPVDLSFCMHTDAGITTGVVGSLMIYTPRGENRKEQFPDGRDRLLSRDLGDMVQTQIVDDLRAKYCSSWTRRDLYSGNYAETRRPNHPAAMVEFLSHQNYDDMKFALDPRFRFDTARAMYKGILRYLAAEHGQEAVIQPLPPQGLALRTIGPNRVRVSWQPVMDPLEPSAAPTAFVVYRRAADGGFDNGTPVPGAASTTLDVQVPDPQQIYSFRVTAANAGGESFPSETLSTRIGATGQPRALIVSAFTRLSGPACITGDDREGLDRATDRGVGDGWTCGLAGDQYDFDHRHAWVGDDTPFTNDNPGHGASSADLETTRELGNTFDFVYRHGKSFASCGWAFDSISADALAADKSALAGATVVDWLLGEQRTTMPPPAHDGKTGSADRMKPQFETWPTSHRTVVKDLLSSGGKLFVSGAYVATDLVASPTSSPEGRRFLSEVLSCSYITDHATRTNIVKPSPTEGPFRGLPAMRISSGIGEDEVYGVELAGGIEGGKKQPPAVLRYDDGDVGAAVASDQGGGRRIVLAFPFECVLGEANRTQLLKSALDYLLK